MKKRLSLVLAVMMVVAVFTLIFAAMALPVSAATEAGDADVVATVYWHTEDDFAAVPTENKIEVTKAEMLTKLLANSNDNVTKAKAEADNYIWVVFATDAQISLERNGEGIGFYVAKDKKLTIEGNGAVYRFNMDNYDNGSNATVIKCVGTGTNPGTVVFNDFTVNSKNDAALNPAGCTVELNNTVLDSSRHKGINITAGNAKVVLDGVSTVYGGQHTMQVTSSNQLEVQGPFNGNLFTLSVSGDAGKATFNGVTLNGRLNVSYLKGTVEIKDTTITSYSAVSCTPKDSGPREIIISGSSVISSDADTNVVTIPAGATVTLRDSAIIRSTLASSYPAAVSNSGTLNVEGGRIEAKRFAVRMYASSVTNIKGGTVTSPCDGLLRVDASDVEINISGEDTLVENTETNKCIINTNGKDNVTISITDGATLKSGGNVIYANGGAALDIDIDNATLETTATAKNVIQRNTPSATDTTTITGSMVTGGGLALGGTATIDDTTVNSGTNTDAITFSGTTLDITNGSTITAGENKYTIKISSAAEVTIDGGSTVTSVSTGDRVSATQTHGHIIFGTNGITLNISGEGTVVEGTATTAPNTVSGVIDINRMNNATINVEDGATIRSKAVNCIYNLGNAGTKVYINISGEDTLIQAGETGNKQAILMRQEQGTEGEFNMTGGTVNGTIAMSVSTKINVSITGGAINGQLNLQQTATTTTALFKDVTISYVASGGSNTIDLGNIDAEFDNVTINASNGCHAITARSEVDLKKTTINLTGTTIAVRAIASNADSAANITIDGECVLNGDARGAAWADTGTIEINNGATVTIEAGAVVSAKIGNAIGVKSGGQLYSEGDISTESGMALVNFGYVELTGGSITTGTTELDIPALVGEGGVFGDFSDVAITGTLKAAQGTFTLNETKVTLADAAITLEGGASSAITVTSGDLTLDNVEVDPGTDNDAITFGGSKLTITNGSEITAAENKYTIKITSAATVTIDGGSVVTSVSTGDATLATRTHGHIFFGTNGITLNISGEGTIVEGTATTAPNTVSGVIDINRTNNATINVEDGATIRSKAVNCIYNLGNAGTKVYINISGEDTLIQAGETGNKQAILMRQEQGTEGEFNMTGGTVNGCIAMSVNTKIKIKITGGAINGQLNLQQTANTNKAIFKDVTITYVASGGSNTIDLANLPAEFENCTINASNGCHAITTRSAVDLKGTTINLTGGTIAVRAYASNADSSANIHIMEGCNFIGDTRGGAWADTGTIEIQNGASVTIDAGATVSSKGGNAIGVKTGGVLYSEGNLSSQTGMVLVNFGYVELAGGSVTTGTTALDLPTLIGEGGVFGDFSNVAITGTLIAAEGTVVGNGGVITLGGNKLIISGGNISSVEADSVEITGGTIASANIADGAVILTDAVVGSMSRSAAASSIVANASGATFNGVTARIIEINGITAGLNNVTGQILVADEGADVTATNSAFTAAADGALVNVAGAATVTLNNTNVTNTGAGAAIAVADTTANEINVNNSQIKANSTVISAKDGENAQAATLNLNNVKIFANEGTPIEGEAALGFYVAAVKNPANAGAAEGQVEIDGVIYNVYSGAQGGAMTATDGASIRISTGSNGLRFTSILTKKTVDYINSITTDASSVEFGTAIFPTHLLAEAGLTTFDVPALKAKGYTVLEIPAKDAMNNRILGADGIEVVGYTINAAITNIKDDHLDWAYSAITYIKYTDATGEHVVYGTYDAENNSRSIIYVANKAYDDVKAPEDEGYNSSYAYPVGGGKYSPYTPTQRAAIKAIIDKYAALNP